MSLRPAFRLARLPIRQTRNFATSQRFFDNDRSHPNVEEHRKHQKETPLNPHLTNTNSTISNEMPSIGKDKPPPEFISAVDPKFVPQDSVPENTERMTGGTQKGGPNSGVNKELDVGEMEDVSFKVDPLKRTGEDANTMRARLLYQSRKRGTLESDLLLSTFADANLDKMSEAQLQQYDRFLDENDWDIYYWVTQEPTPTSMEYAEGGPPKYATPVAQGKPAKGVEEQPPKEQPGWMETTAHEWAATVGRQKPAYRPVPSRWKNSEILSLLKKHVLDRSAGGVHNIEAEVQGKGLNQSVQGTGGGGLGRMPDVRNFDT